MSTPSDEKIDYTGAQPPDLPTTTPGEPALSTGTFVSLGTLITEGVVLFGIPLDVQQKAWLAAMVALLAPLVASLVIRFKVFSPKSVEVIKQELKIALAIAEQQRVAKENAQVSFDASIRTIQAAARTRPKMAAQPPQTSSAARVDPPTAPATPPPREIPTEPVAPQYRDDYRDDWTPPPPPRRTRYDNDIYASPGSYGDPYRSDPAMAESWTPPPPPRAKHHFRDEG